MAFRRIGTTSRVRTCGHCGKTGLAKTVVFTDGRKRVHLGTACARSRGNVGVAARRRDRAVPISRLKKLKVGQVWESPSTGNRWTIAYIEDTHDGVHVGARDKGGYVHRWIPETFDTMRLVSRRAKDHAASDQYAGQVASRLTERQRATMAWMIENWPYPYRGSPREDGQGLVELGLLEPYTDDAWGAPTQLGQRVWKIARRHWRKETGLGAKFKYAKDHASSELDPTAATELKLFIENDGDLHRQQGEPILKNLANKAASGKYDHEKAIKFYMYLMESGAKKYIKEVAGSGNWHEMFNVPTRREAARDFVHNFEAEYKLGNYDHLLTKAAAKRKAAGQGNLARSGARNAALLRHAPAKDWKVIHVHDRGAGQYYRYQIDGRNLNYSPDGCCPNFPASVLV